MIPLAPNLPLTYLARFPIRCLWAKDGSGGREHCDNPAALAVTSGCPDGAGRGDPREWPTCADHLAMFEDKYARTGWHFDRVCCDGSHGRMVLSTRRLNEGDLP